MRLLFSIWSILLFSSAGVCGPQQCRDVNGDSANAATKHRFAVQENGTVIDRQTHLIWLRCSVGQQWDSEHGTCSGQAQTMAWTQARQLGQGWRLPSIQELSSITELRCYNPAIDLRIFPNTPASHYWTGTPFINQPGHFWLVQFTSGENHTDSGKRLAHVRLVRQLTRISHQGAR